MSHDHNSRTPRPIRFLFENSLFLVFGALGALIWANSDPKSYDAFVHYTVVATNSHSHDEAAHDTQNGHGHKADDHADDHKSDDHADDHKTNDQGADDHKSDDHADDHKSDDHADDHKSDDHADDHKTNDQGADDHNHAAAAHGADGDGHSNSKQASHGGHASDGNNGDAHDENHSHGHGFTLHWVVNDLLMALFFAIAGKEVWESVLPGGALSNPRKAATPLLATLGGIVGPAGVYLVGVAMVASSGDLARGWAIPCATDIAFSYLVARMIFGSGHPAIAFLLLLAIADDAAGLVILAVFFPQHELQLTWLLLTAFAVGLGFAFRRMRLHSHWWYLAIPGAMSWFSFYQAGLHPALGLVPIIPCMPHAHTDLGIFAAKEWNRKDTLNEFEHWWSNPVELILGLFGLVNAGVVFSAVGAGTWLVLLGLIVGKPLGITFFTWLGEKMFGLQVPAGMNYRHIITLGNIAAIGFTVALFVSTAAFPNPGPIQDSVKMGALMSFGAAVISFIVAKALGVKPGQLANQASDKTVTANAVASGS